MTESPEFKMPAATGLPFIVGFFFSFRLFIMLLSVRLLGTDDQTGVEISLVLNFLLPLLVAFQSLWIGRPREPEHVATAERPLDGHFSMFLWLQFVVERYTIPVRGNCLLVRDGRRCWYGRPR